MDVHFFRPRPQAWGCGVLALIVLLSAAASGEETNRNEAFIGYREHGVAGCKDLLSDCQSKAQGNECIVEPYTMRATCPISCSLERCLLSSKPGALGDQAREAPVPFEGYATPAGTHAFANGYSDLLSSRHYQAVSFAPGGAAVAGASGAQSHLLLSSLGVGTYLGAVDAETDEQQVAAVLYSVSHGWNVIDTASNYRSGRAEVAVGEALQQLLGSWRPTPAASVASRAALFVSTKAGFFDAAEQQQVLGSMEGVLAADFVDLGGGYSHCMAPQCLTWSLKRSLQRLRLATVDLFYLHNAAEVQLPVVGRDAFMQRLLLAFKGMEAMRTQGLLRGYGLATWDCFRQPPDGTMYLNLGEVVRLARQAGGPQHGFLGLQLPMNIAMREAWEEGWQDPAPQAPPPPRTGGAGAAGGEDGVVGDGSDANGPGSNASLVGAAGVLGVAVFTSGPLQEGQLLHSHEIVLDEIIPLGGLGSTADKLLNFARSTPGIACTLVGHKARDHVESNVGLSMEPRLGPHAFLRVQEQLRRALSEEGDDSGAA